MKSNTLPTLQRGALLIEVLVAILICAFALLGFVAMQSRATLTEFESYQRSQALFLLDDMANRININRANAGAYVSGTLMGGGALVDCDGKTRADIDLCEWGNLIRGSAEIRGGSSIGSMISARGCIARSAGSTDRYVLSLVWQGMVPTGAPAGTCGKGDVAFPAETLRRMVSSTVCVGLLHDAASAPSLARC
ncbi:MAG: type IV pilus modification protein PilV [Burkholderiales bacterium]|jgi:type IV pilus assembly protein PilV|nr:type IV pilus modification protein PilV [Burkholderiales bacterium]